MAARPSQPRLRGASLLACLLGVGLGVVLGTGGCNRGDAKDGDDDEAQDETPAIAVRAEAARRESIAALYATSTTLRPRGQATVTARTRGVVRRIAVEEGDSVTAGQPLAFLEDEEQRISAGRAAASRDTRRSEAERAATLHDRGLVSDEARDAAAREASEARHAAELADLALTRTVIRAPFAGRVLARRIDVGASVADGTPVFEVADTHHLEADVSVPERHVARLAIGQDVRLVIDATREPSLARVERIAPSVDTTTGTVKVTLTLAEGADLRPGAFARVEIVTDVHDDALVVPRSALVAEGRRWHVFRVAGTGVTVEQLTATLGFEEGDRVEILATEAAGGPLAAGQRIVVAGASALAEGAKVNVVDANGAAPQGATGGAGGST